MTGVAAVEACSASRVRRLLSGELSGPEQERCARHVGECARCQAVQREVAQEKAQLEREVPFEAFAAGVAEKLALRPARRSLPARVLPYAAAVVLVAGAGLLRGPLAEEPREVRATRSKGAAGVELFLQDARGVRELGREDKVAAGARLQLSLRPAGRKYATAALLEPGEVTVLYSGAAVQGPLPQAFEWTGSGAATLLVVLSDQPVQNLRAAADAPPGAEVFEVPLRR